MTELPPQLQQPQSPEQRPTPTNVAKGFLNRWIYKIAAANVSILAVNTGLQSQESFARGDLKGGFLHLGMAAVETVSTGFIIAADRRRERNQ